MKKLIRNDKTYTYNDYKLEIHESNNRSIVKLFNKDEELDQLELLYLPTNYDVIVFNMMAKLLEVENGQHKEDNRSAN